MRFVNRIVALNGLATIMCAVILGFLYLEIQNNGYAPGEVPKDMQDMFIFTLIFTVVFGLFTFLAFVFRLFIIIGRIITGAHDQYQSR